MIIKLTNVLNDKKIYFNINHIISFTESRDDMVNPVGVGTAITTINDENDECYIVAEKPETIEALITSAYLQLEDEKAKIHRRYRM